MVSDADWVDDWAYGNKAKVMAYVQAQGVDLEGLPESRVWEKLNVFFDTMEPAHAADHSTFAYWARMVDDLVEEDGL